MRQALSATGGSALALGTRAIALLRPAAKPLHPVGVTLRGQLRRLGSERATGVAWIEDPGQDDVLVRLSRAIGLPSALPDIHGLALRVLGTEGPADILLATTGWGRLSRFALTFGRQPESRPLTSLLPYRTDIGAVVLGARATAPGSYQLSWAPYDGDWVPFADLELTGELAHDQSIAFDPVLNQVPGLAQYPFVVRLREPSYLWARRSRQDRTEPTER